MIPIYSVESDRKIESTNESGATFQEATLARFDKNKILSPGFQLTLAINNHVIGLLSSHDLSRGSKAIDTFDFRLVEFVKTKLALHVDEGWTLT